MNPLVIGVVVVGLFGLLKLFQMSPFNDFGNDIVITDTPETREMIVRIQREEGWKPRWRVIDKKTSQVLMTRGFSRLHVLNCTDPDIDYFMRDVMRAQAKVCFFTRPSNVARAYIETLENNGKFGYETREYVSDKVKAGKMTFCRRKFSGSAMVFRVWGPRMGGGLSLYRGEDLMV